VDELLAKTNRDIARFRASHERWRRGALVAGFATLALPILSVIVWTTTTGVTPMIVRSAFNGGGVNVFFSE